MYLMARCFPDCFILPPNVLSGGCTFARKAGGITRLVFSTCEIDTSDVSQWSALTWCQLYNEGKVSISNKLIASKPESSYQKRKLTSCSAESVVGITHKIEFEDLNLDFKSFKDQEFWQTLIKDPTRYPFGWVDCDGYFTGFFNPVAIEVSKMIPNSNLDSQHWRGVIEFNTLMLPNPIVFESTLESLLTGCDGVPNFNKCKYDLVLDYLNSVDSGCSQGDVTVVAPYINGATYEWYVNNVLVVSTDSRFFNPAQFDVDVKVVIKVDGCADNESDPVRVYSLNDGTLPAITGVSITSDGAFYHRVEVNVATPNPNIEYRLINSAGYVTAWQDTNIFRGVIRGSTTVQIRLSSLICVLTYNFII